MDFDEIEYLERTLEDPTIRAKERRISRGGEDGGDGRESRSARRPMPEQNGEKADRDDRERSSRRDKDHNRSIRDAEREHGKDRDRRSLSRDYREKVRERERDKDKERERSRRSSSRLSRHEREDESERRRARSRERAARERELEREMLERERRRFKERRESVEPEADPERDQRTVFAFQMPLKATERDVYEFFSQVGKVRDVRLIMDRNSRRSKGVGYIEFYDAMSVPQAIALTGHLLLGQPVMVKPSEAEKNLVQSNAAGGSALAGAATERKLYVGNLHYNMTEYHLRQIFEAFGPVEQVQLPLDSDTGHCKGYGFIQFAQLEHAKAARSLNGTLDIAGRTIKVSAVTDHVGGQNAATNATNAADFDDEDGGGLSLNARSRAILMQKLDRTGTATSMVASLGVPGLSNGAVVNQQISSLPISGLAAISPALLAQRPLYINEPSVEPSECLLFMNMFDPATETEPDFDLDIKEEVEEECSKFGPVKHIFVDKNSSGVVYLRFESVAAAASCQRAMDKRWYAGRLISVTFMPCLYCKEVEWVQRSCYSKGRLFVVEWKINSSERPHEYETRFRSNA